MKRVKDIINKKTLTPENLSKKHGVELSYIKAQIKNGTKVEQEHTSIKSVARKIALKHIEEFPDYYTRLKKAESK